MKKNLHCAHSLFVVKEMCNNHDYDLEIEAFFEELSKIIVGRKSEKNLHCAHSTQLVLIDFCPV